MNNVEYFLNDNFKILKCLCENEITLQGKKVVSLSQNDIAKETNLSKGRVNKTLKSFSEMDLIRMASAGKYVIYKKGHEIYDLLSNK